MRLPGSGGANDLASFCWRTLIVMKHDAKKFVEKLDFLTTPGYLTGPGAREAAGLPQGHRPAPRHHRPGRVRLSPETKRMRVQSLHPGKTLEQVQAATGFELEVAESVGVTRAECGGVAIVEGGSRSAGVCAETGGMT